MMDTKRICAITKVKEYLSMDRKKYWNEEYTKYWKNVTNDANEKGGDKTKIIKSTSGDYKSVGEQVADLLFAEMNYDKKEKLLDYGYGFGRFFIFFNNKTDYYGIDISEDMISECKTTYPTAAEKFIVAEGEKSPFEDGFFSKIICFGVFDACYQEQALFEMMRMTKIGGRILITGKNNKYLHDDEQAYIAEEAARKKGHPNYFTDVKNMLEQLSDVATIELQRYFIHRGDFGKNLYVTDIPEKFYEYAFIIKKNNNCEHSFERFSDAYSTTWKEINN